MRVKTACYLALRANRLIALVALFGLALSSCSWTESSSCESDLDLTECYVADAYAICGESAGPPRFACDESGMCKWFLGDCPAGFIASDCPADDLCCHDNWPFSGPEALVDFGSPVAAAHNFLYGFQIEPWTPDRGLTLDVEVDPDLVAMAEFTCEGTEPYSDILFGSPCEWISREAAAGLDDTLVITTRYLGATEGWFARVEVEPEEGSPKARVCAYRYTDSIGATCPRKRPFACAESGIVTLNRMPTTRDELVGLQVDFDVVFANGFRHAGGYAAARTFD